MNLPTVKKWDLFILVSPQNPECSVCVQHTMLVGRNKVNAFSCLSPGFPLYNTAKMSTMYYRNKEQCKNSLGYEEMRMVTIDAFDISQSDSQPFNPFPCSDSACVIMSMVYGPQKSVSYFIKGHAGDY